MKRGLCLILLLVAASCAPFPRDNVAKAKLEIENLYYADLPRYYPDEWNIMKGAWQKLEEAEREKDTDAALRWYYFTMHRAPELEEMIESKHREDEAELLRQQQEAETKESPGTEKKGTGRSRPPVVKERSPDEIRKMIEKRFPSFYTVREGDSLESIAESPAIYNDRYLWPLIYKYNRNQISSPKKLYAGQILKIPRNISVDEVMKTREDSGASSTRTLPKKTFNPDRYRKYVQQLMAED